MKFPQFVPRIKKFFKKRNNIIIVLGIIVLVILIIRLTYNNKESFIREHFSVSNAGNIFGNPQISRDGSNITVHPPMEEGLHSIIVGTAGDGFTDNQNTEGQDRERYIIVDMGKNMRVEAIAASNVRQFQVQTSSEGITTDNFLENPVFNNINNQRSENFINENFSGYTRHPGKSLTGCNITLPANDDSTEGRPLYICPPDIEDCHAYAREMCDGNSNCRGYSVDLTKPRQFSFLLERTNCGSTDLETNEQYDFYEKQNGGGNTRDISSIMFWDNLQNSNGASVFSRYVKFIPSGPVENMKIEVFAVEPETLSRDLMTSGTQLDYILYNENGNELSGDRWQSETGNSNPFVKAKFIDSSGENRLSRNVLVNRIVITGEEHDTGNGGGPPKYRILYQSNHPSDTIHRTEIINGCQTDTSTNRYYFTHPVLASWLKINPSGNDNNIYKMRVQIYGTVPTPELEERAIRAIQNIRNAELNKDKDTCPSVNELLNKQSSASQLCDALEYQEKIRNNKAKLEKNKLYLRKIQNQKEKIQQLERVLDELNTQKESREQKEDMYKMAQYEYQNAVDQQLTDLAKERLRNQQRLRMNVNLVNQRGTGGTGGTQ